jgi:formylglycine-generating enzyme required for sulfatase activity
MKVMIMKYLFLSVYLLSPLRTMAQASGGEIKRSIKMQSSNTTIISPVIKCLIKNMVFVEGGTFTMGATSEQGGDVSSDEKPTHGVKLSSFYICKYEVTQEEWQAVMGSNPSEYKGTKHPVDNVSWKDCQDFISKLNTITGKQFRLPTEAEWEFAARGGNLSKGYKYAGSNNPTTVAWYDCYPNGSHNVGQKKANELGLYDMSGNVYEWCSDGYGFYSSSLQINPSGVTNGTDHVIRGGGWFSLDANDCRLSYRFHLNLYERNPFVGLRLAL